MSSGDCKGSSKGTDGGNASGSSRGGDASTGGGSIGVGCGPGGCPGGMGWVTFAGAAKRMPVFPCEDAGIAAAGRRRPPQPRQEGRAQTGARCRYVSETMAVVRVASAWIEIGCTAHVSVEAKPLPCSCSWLPRC